MSRNNLALGILGILTAPSIALAALNTFTDLANLALKIINSGIGVVLILGIVIYFYGVATSIPKMKEGDPERLRAHFFWGLLALFVMFSVWGILNVVANTLFGGGGTDALGGSTGPLCEGIGDCEIGAE